MKCTTIKFGRYESIEVFKLSLTSDDQAAILTNAVIDVTVVPDVVFTRNRLSVEIAIRGLTVATVRHQHTTAITLPEGQYNVQIVKLSWLYITDPKFHETFHTMT